MKKHSDFSPHEKAAVRRKIKFAIKAGKITRKPCERCGKPKSVAHHDDYNFPLRITFLCEWHHKERHFELGWGLSGRPIRTFRGVPVDAKKGDGFASPDFNTCF